MVQLRFRVNDGFADIDGGGTVQSRYNEECRSMVGILRDPIDFYRSKPVEEFLVPRMALWATGHMLISSSRLDCMYSVLAGT